MTEHDTSTTLLSSGAKVAPGRVCTFAAVRAYDAAAGHFHANGASYSGGEELTCALPQLHRACATRLCSAQQSGESECQTAAETSISPAKSVLCTPAQQRFVSRETMFRLAKRPAHAYSNTAGRLSVCWPR